MIYVVGYLVLLALTLAFVAGAKRASYSDSEIEADYDRQYRDLNGLA
jgi:hypothetical protein